MIELKIPGFAPLRSSCLASDYNGTIAVDGGLIRGVSEKLNVLAEILDVHVVTADTFRIVRQELADVNCVLRILEGEGRDRQKEAYVEKLGGAGVVAFGNGRNDRLMLAAARIGIAVLEEKGVRRCRHERCRHPCAEPPRRPRSAHPPETADGDPADLTLPQRPSSPQTGSEYGRIFRKNYTRASCSAVSRRSMPLPPEESCTVAHCLSFASASPEPMASRLAATPSLSPRATPAV